MSRIRVAFNIQDNPSDLSQVADDNTGGPDSALIPKPPGEVTRVNRGGYNLDDTLGWAPEILDGLKKFLFARIDKVLDKSQTITNQSPEILKAIYDAAVDEFPILQNYEDAWPAADIVKQRLHYTSTSGRTRIKKIRAANRKEAVATGSKFQLRSQTKAKD